MNKTIGALLCRFLGHKERKLYKDEGISGTAQPTIAPGDADHKRVRRCTRCGATRLARARKGKKTT